jgi:hypothetical protein
MKFARYLLPLAIGMISITANADVLRCGSVIIEEGDSRVKVMEHCGEPVVDEGARWYYKKSNDVTTVLHFEADKVTYIEDERD